LHTPKVIKQQIIERKENKEHKEYNKYTMIFEIPRSNKA